jgi:predicted transcriptional regulator
MNDQHRQELLRSSAAYAAARLAFANAIVIAQRAGETDEEIAHVTGYTVTMIRAVLRTPRLRLQNAGTV